jgi:ribosomal protein S18 acetylase RimI-like enzyme
MPNKIHVRPAQQSDREDVFKFCKHTFDWGDYIPHVWDTWLKQKHGRVFTALMDNKPVGIMRVSITKPGEVWLQAARTHPDYRRRGIATALTDACLEWARSKGAETAVLSTDSDNYAAQKIIQKLGFTQVSDFLIMLCKGIQAAKTEISRWAQKSDTEKIWKFLAESEVFEKSAGLYTVIFTWMSLGKQDLAKFIANRKAIVYEDGGTINGLALIDETVKDVWEDEKPFQTCYVDGDRQAIIDMMDFFKTYSAQQGIMNVYAFVCNMPTIASALTEIGFKSEEDHTELIYLKRLS